MTAPPTSAVPSRAVTPLLVLICGGMILFLNLGIRQSFGLFIEPMRLELGWAVGTFSLAFALQNLMWGVTQPFFGAIADRYGAARTIMVGAGFYIAGLLIMAMPGTPLMFQFGAGFVLSLGLSGTAFAVVLAAIGRAHAPEKRSMALGIGSAAGSFGQFAMAPTGQWLIESTDWSTALMIYAGLMLIALPCALALAGKMDRTSSAAEPLQSLGAALAEAARHRGYWLLTLGFFVCGFHVAFIATHMPGFVASCNLPPEVGAWSLAIIGLFNVIGTLGAGALGSRYKKPYLLSFIYAARAAVIIVFVLVPPTSVSVLVFSGAMGLLWLSTVPLTSGLVAQVFGPRYMSTLFGVVFLSHQVGAFFGAWLGGVVFDATGNFDLIWYISAGLGVLAAVLNWPIRDTPVPRLATAG